MKYEKHLRKSLNAGTLRKRLMNLKVFFNHLVIEEGYKTNKFVKNSKTKRFEPDFVVLNESQIKAFENFEVQNGSQQRVRDIFIVLLYTGLAIGDYNELKSLHVQNNRIVKEEKRLKLYLKYLSIQKYPRLSIVMAT